MSDLRRLRAKIYEEEYGLFIGDQSFLWDMAIENLKTQLNGETLDADSRKNEELLKILTLNDWEKMKGKLTEVDDVYRKFSKTIDMWIYMRKQMEQLNVDTHQTVSWIIKEKMNNRLFGRTKQATLWQEIEDFIKSMEKLQMLLNSNQRHSTKE